MFSRLFTCLPPITPSACSKTLSIADDRSPLADAVDANSWQSLVAFLVAETGRPLPLFSRPLKQTHGAWPKGSTLPCTMQNATLDARGASPREVAHAERRWRRHGGKTPPRRGSAAAHEGEGTLLAAGPREARSYSSHGDLQQRRVEPPHLQSQQQTLSTASRVEQA